MLAVGTVRQRTKESASALLGHNEERVQKCQKGLVLKSQANRIGSPLSVTSRIFFWPNARQTAPIRASIEPKNSCLKSDGSIEAQLDASPWLKFLIEVYPDGINDIAAKKLFRRYEEWCADERRSGVLNQTNFGRKLRKLTAPEGVKGSLLPLAKRLTNTGYRYEISPMREFDLALFFGLTGSDERLDPSPVNGSTPNPPPPDPAPAAGSQSGVNSVNSFSRPLHAERNEVGSKKGEKPKRKNPSNPPHPSLPGLNTAPIGSAHDVESDDDDPHWGPKTA